MPKIEPNSIKKVGNVTVSYFDTYLTIMKIDVIMILSYEELKTICKDLNK